MAQHKKTPLIGIMGGTFDPIHFGHLRTALELKQILGLEGVRLVPCKDPVHKDQTFGSAMDRLGMLHLAIANTPGLDVDDTEIRRHTPSYTIDTLESTRDTLPEASLCLIMGSDSFESLPTWKRWQHLLDLAHIIVVMRPGHTFSPSTEIKQLLVERQLADPQGLRELTSGYIYLQAISALDISATTIRNQIATGYDPRFLLPNSVLDYINEHQLYLTGSPDKTTI